MFKDFIKSGKASFIIGGQWGSEGKGAAAAFLARQLAEHDQLPGVITTNAGAQAGHTSTHNGKTRVAFHLPTATLIARDYGVRPLTYLNAGAIIDPAVLLEELEAAQIKPGPFIISPRAAVITDECREAEGRDDSAQTKIASTRKGVGEALARKVLRSGMIAVNHRDLVRWVDSAFNLGVALNNKASVLVEVPQGIGLSLNNGGFYPHCTSRDCTVMQAASDAGIHPHHYGASLLVLRTYPIRVGNILQPGGDYGTEKMSGYSGPCYPDQREIEWGALGVKPEITTVTKRVRRVFTFSRAQALDAIRLTRPTHIQLTFCDYPGPPDYVRKIGAFLVDSAVRLGLDAPTMLYQYGPTTDDVYPEPK